MTHVSGIEPDPATRPQPSQHPELDAETRSVLEQMLADYGVDSDQIDALWQQVTDELGSLPRDKPLLTILAAFAVGFILGRMSK